MDDKPGPPQFWSNPDEGLRKVAQIVSQLQRGESNAARNVTLRTGETTTEVLISFAKLGMLVVFSAMNQAAATDIAAGTIWATVTDGKVTFTHGSSSASRDIGFALHG